MSTENQKIDIMTATPVTTTRPPSCSLQATLT